LLTLAQRFLAQRFLAQRFLAQCFLAQCFLAQRLELALKDGDLMANSGSGS
jgi:hypothetical protein